MPASFPTCSTILLFESVFDHDGRTCFCGILRDVTVSHFPYKLDRWDFHVFIDGDSGQYDITHELSDSGGNVIGRGVWGRFHHITPNKSTHLLGQSEFTVPEFPCPGTYTITTILRKDGDERQVGKFRLELTEADTLESASDFSGKGVAPEHLSRTAYAPKN